jgi:hypothetical protein
MTDGLATLSVPSFMIAKDFIPEMGTKAFVIMKCPVLAPCRK